MSNNNQRTKPHEVHNVTLKSGAPIGDKFNSLLVGPTGPNLLADVAYLEETAHFNRERIPERVVHAKGQAAYGYFQVTNSKITDYCKAALFSSINKTTPIAVRFSHVTGESGISDTPRDVRGFAVKFYTEAGNWDLVGNNLPVFFVRDPINFSSFIHSQKRHPKSHLRDPDSFWDFASQLPETMHTLMMLFSDRGTPDGFRHMHGYGVDTFKLINAAGVASYAKFHWICGQGIRNLDHETALKVAGLDPDYSIRDLHKNIAQGNFPTWTLKFQIMSQDEASKITFNPFDVTKTWPHTRFPPIEIGKMILNKNPDDYFAQVEQLAFSPANMVPGIEPSLDKMLIGRMFSYPDAQRYRLGVNYTELGCNRARCPVLTPTYRDGLNSTPNSAWSLSNYIPSSKLSNLKMPNANYPEFPQAVDGIQGRFDLSGDDNFSQPRDLISRVLKRDEFSRLCSNIAGHLGQVIDQSITKKVLAHFNELHPPLAVGVISIMNAKLDRNSTKAPKE